MKLTQEQIDWATNESKSNFPGRLVTIAITSRLVGSKHHRIIFLDQDYRDFKKDDWDDAATFLNGERYYVETYAQLFDQYSKGYPRGETVDHGSIKGTGGTE